MLPHKNNIESKIRVNYKGAKEIFKKFYEKYYLPWHKKNINIKGLTKKDVWKKVKILNRYYQSVNRMILSFKKKGGITSQSKFRPTVLEEFCYYLFKDLKEIKKLKLGFYKKNIYVGFKINSEGKITTIKKDVDFCIGREEEGQIGGKKIRFIIPIISVECKTYLDGTMWNESQYTAMLIKRANPLAKVYILAEANYVDLDKITQDSPIDEIFIVRKSRDKKIEPNVIYEFFIQIKEDLKQITKKRKNIIIGRLINRSKANFFV